MADTPKTISDKALELVMRDVLDGMLDISAESAFSLCSDSFRIIEISPERYKSGTTNEDTEAEILPFPPRSRVANG
ncbi:MAG: integration host factor subunit beta [Gammaproteobacteria bacterium]|nr:integration host factor subunit beta [Gammaproteobacteria bacterium]